MRDMGGGANVQQDQKDRKKRGGEKSNGEGGAWEQEEKSGSKALDQLGNPVALAGTRNVEAVLVTTENTATRMNGKFQSRCKKVGSVPNVLLLFFTSCAFTLILDVFMLPFKCQFKAFFVNKNCLRPKVR